MKNKNLPSILITVIVVVIGFILFQTQNAPWNPLSMLGRTGLVGKPIESNQTRANQLIQAGQYDQAMAIYQLMIQSGESIGLAYAGIGNIQMRERRYDEAAVSYTAALNSERTSDVLTSRCEAYRFLAKEEAALADCNEAIRVDPKNSSAYSILGLMYLDKGQKDKAREVVDNALSVDNKSVNAYYVLSQLEMSQGHTDKAIEALTQCITLEPKTAQFYWDRGFTYYTLGKIDAASADMNKILEIGSPEKDGELMLQAGTFLGMIGSRDGGKPTSEPSPTP